MTTKRTLIISDPDDCQLTVSDDTDDNGLHFTATHAAGKQVEIWVSYEDMCELLDFGEDQRQIQSAVRFPTGEPPAELTGCYELEVDGEMVRIQGVDPQTPEAKDAIEQVVRAVRDRQSGPPVESALDDN